MTNQKKKNHKFLGAIKPEQWLIKYCTSSKYILFNLKGQTTTGKIFFFNILSENTG